MSLGTLQNNLPEAIDAAHTVGINYLICPFLTADQRQNLDAYKQLADQFNVFGEKCQEAGLQFAYHNHSFEFGEMEGEIPYNLLLDSTESDLVAMELDLFWIKMAGYDPVDYFNEYPGRFPTVHVKDMKKKMVLENPLSTFENQQAIQKAFGSLEDVGKA
ncbi:TIM barrel protein [Aliifodinibius sp. S!AR15-10]|uniref:sugar phosphate isomerase/epimerase family protein n=1 Tax=Aliifodinibius sp. S!AR15-10 TaxID=2950437 RepID=UPI0028581339|nr:TIM barrel protein [Aliifodinibius sp. S!AR15-10]MDR8391594.1 TIM barrel protein [Aliifodinibius sp. S!AR15-10]